MSGSPPPQPAYGAPHQAYGPPHQAYGPPHQAYGYGPPHQAYGPPQQAYGAPYQAYGYPPASPQGHAAYGASPYGYGYAYPPPGPIPPTKRVRPLLYFLPILGLIASIFPMVWGLEDHAVDELVVPSVVAMIVFGVGWVVCGYILLYKGWSAIQDGYARTTPGKAVGYLFIPFFSIYWVFVGVGSWAKEFNAFADRHQLPGFRASPGLFMTYPIATIASMLFSLAFLVNVVVVPLCMWQLCKAINTVAEGGLPSARVLNEVFS